MSDSTIQSPQPTPAPAYPSTQAEITASMSRRVSDLADRVERAEALLAEVADRVLSK